MSRPARPDPVRQGRPGGQRGKDPGPHRREGLAQSPGRGRAGPKLPVETVPGRYPPAAPPLHGGPIVHPSFGRGKNPHGATKPEKSLV